MPGPGLGGGTLHGAVAGTGGWPVNGQIPDCASTDGLAATAAANSAAPISLFSLYFILERIISLSPPLLIFT